MFRYLNGVKLVRIQAAQFFLIGYIRVEAVQVKVLRQIDRFKSGDLLVSAQKSKPKAQQVLFMRAV